MKHVLMTRYQYNLPVALYERLLQLKEKKGESINAMITKAIVAAYPELRSIPAQTLASVIGAHGQTRPP